MDLPRNNNGDVSFVARALRMWLAAHMVPHKVFASDCGRSLHTVRDWIYGRSIPNDYNCELIVKVICSAATYGDMHRLTNKGRLKSMVDADRHYREGKLGHPYEDMMTFKNTAFFI
jgi:hypothetical protein